MGLLHKLTESLEGKKLLNQERLITKVTERFHELMEQQRLTQKDLAKRLGVKPPRVSKLLSGKSNMTLRTLSDICTVMDVPIIIHIGESNAAALERANKKLTTVERQLDSVKAFQRFHDLQKSTSEKFRATQHSFEIVAN